MDWLQTWPRWNRLQRGNLDQDESCEDSIASSGRTKTRSQEEGDGKKKGVENQQKQRAKGWFEEQGNKGDRRVNKF